MPKFDLVAALEGRKRELLVELLRQHPQLTLADLQQLARGELGSLLRSITLAELQGPQVLQTALPGKAASAKVTAPPPTIDVTGPDVNTRSSAGREAFDRKILAAVTAIRGWVSASEVQSRVGGTNLQVRAGLNRLIDAGALTWLGQARGTRYHLA